MPQMPMGCSHGKVPKCGENLKTLAEMCLLWQE
jgi:hypothetical protein